MILELLFCLVLVLYLKWIFISMMYICEALNVFYIHHKTNVLCKMMAVPYHVIEYMLRYGGSRFVMFNIAEIPSVHFRRLLYKGLGAQIEKNVIMHFRTEIRGTYKLKIGEGTIIGDNALLDARSGLYIGKNVNLSSNVSIYTLQHNYRSKDFGCDFDKDLSVTIDDRAWLGCNVIVLPGVHIGEGAVCCAGCVVSKNVAPFTVVAGILAKKIADRPNDIFYEFNGKSCRLY